MYERGEPGGLVLPPKAEEASKPLPTTGIVIKVGDEWRGPEAKWVIGRMVMFGPYAGEGCKFSDNTQLRILDYAQILCTVQSDSAALLTSVIAPAIKKKLGIDILKEAA